MRVKAIQNSIRTKTIMVDWILLTSPTTIRYISGFSGSDGALLISKDHRYIFVDGRYTTQASHQAPDFTLIECKNGILDEMKNHEIRSLGYESKHMSVTRFEKIQSILPGTVMVDITYIVEDMRELKDDEEIQKLKKAARIADQTFSRMTRYIHAGISERQVALEIEYDMRRQGATGTSFDTIVSSGMRTSMPHAKPTDKIIEQGDFVTMDFGCIFESYCSDMTRTIIVGEPTERQIEVYNTVLTAQKAALANIKPDITFKDADAFARQVITDAGFGDNFSHALGHGVGMDVHEKPKVSPKNENFLKKGMVISVEPGIYIPDEFGVRIEDVVLLTENGIENFTHSEKNLIVI